MSNSLINLRRAMYRLKRRFSTPIKLYKRGDPTVDTKTGQKTCSLTSITLRQAIVLQTRDYRMFVYDLAFISANKDFTAGGYFDPTDRRVIIDKKDLPKDYVLTNDQYVTIGSKQYQIFEFSDNIAAYVLQVKALRGERDVLISDTINVLILQDAASAYIDHLTYSVEDTIALTASAIAE